MSKESKKVEVKPVASKKADPVSEEKGPWKIGDSVPKGMVAALRHGKHVLENE